MAVGEGRTDLADPAVPADPMVSADPADPMELVGTTDLADGIGETGVADVVGAAGRKREGTGTSHRGATRATMGSASVAASASTHTK